MCIKRLWLELCLLFNDDVVARMKFQLLFLKQNFKKQFSNNNSGTDYNLANHELLQWYSIRNHFLNKNFMLLGYDTAIRTE